MGAAQSVLVSAGPLAYVFSRRATARYGKSRRRCERFACVRQKAAGTHIEARGRRSTYRILKMCAVSSVRLIWASRVSRLGSGALLFSIRLPCRRTVSTEPTQELATKNTAMRCHRLEPQAPAHPRLNTQHFHFNKFCFVVVVNVVRIVLVFKTSY